MGKHKTKEEWLFWFQKYESEDFLWQDFFDTVNITNKNQARVEFRRKLKKYKEHGESIIISMTGKKQQVDQRGRKLQTLITEQKMSWPKWLEDITK